jgi:hypothetical protein
VRKNAQDQCAHSQFLFNADADIIPHGEACRVSDEAAMLSKLLHDLAYG